MYEKRSAASMLRAVGYGTQSTKGYAYVLCILEKTGNGAGETVRLGWWECSRLAPEQFGIKRAAMERCIRFAIQRTWDTGNDKLKELFGAYDVCCMPTITEFPRSDDGGPVLAGGAGRRARESAGFESIIGSMKELLKKLGGIDAGMLCIPALMLLGCIFIHVLSGEHTAFL